MNGVLGIFALYDEKAEAFLPPWTAPTKAYAMRTVSDMVMDPESMIAKHPADYTLFCVGMMSQETGEIVPEKSSLGSGVQFRAHVVGEQVENAS